MQSFCNRIRRLTRLAATVAAMFVAGVSVRALPVEVVSNGTIRLSGVESQTLRLEVSAPQTLLSRYTIGLYDLSRMTAATDDPDFQVQALQADRVVLLQEAGRPQAGVFEVTVGGGSQLGIFLLRDATLAEFSVGLNPYRPIFSTSGAPGSHLLSPYVAGGELTFTLAGLGSGARVFPAGFAPLAADSLDQLTIRILNDGATEPQAPVVPEPATLALIGIGLAGAAMVRCRR